MNNNEKKELNDKTLEKVNGGLAQIVMPEEPVPVTVPYTTYIGATVYYNGATCKVIDAYAVERPGMTDYFYKLQYTNGTIVTVDKSTFEEIITGIVFA